MDSRSVQFSLQLPPVNRRVLVAVLCAGYMHASSAVEEVQDLRYGATLYHYYQQQWFDALTEVMVAQQLEQLPAHGSEAELLRGGMSLSYGMDKQAKQIFEASLSDAGESVDRDRVWYYLADIAWRRDDLPSAEAALDNINPDYNGDLLQQSLYLKGSVSLALGEESQAINYSQQLAHDSPWLPYLNYNLASARAAAGDWQQAVMGYQSLAQLPNKSDESRSLRDRAFTAVGFTLMAQGDYVGAAGQFTQVRLDSPESDRALLGYGWSAVNRDDYLAALSPWQQLSKRSLMSASARESLLAIPWVYEQLERPTLALESYQHAALQYEAELQQLARATEQLNSGNLLTEFGLEPGDSQEWLGGEDILPLGEYSPYLRFLLSTDRVQLALREYRDLNAIDRHLQRSVERLQILDQVDSDQQASWDTVLKGDRRAQLEQRYRSLGDALSELTIRLSRAEDESDGRALASEDELARWRRLEKARHAAHSLRSEPLVLDRLRIMEGLMHWEGSEKYPARLWQAKREIQELENLSEQTRQALQNVDEATASRQQSSFEARIASLQQRVKAQQAQLDLALAAAEDALRSVAVVELEQQAAGLTLGLSQSRLAIARLYDRASPEVPR